MEMLIVHCRHSQTASLLSLLSSEVRSSPSGLPNTCFWHHTREHVLALPACQLPTSLWDHDDVRGTASPTGGDPAAPCLPGTLP